MEKSDLKRKTSATAPPTKTEIVQPKEIPAEPKTTKTGNSIGFTIGVIAAGLVVTGGTIVYLASDKPPPPEEKRKGNKYDRLI